MSRWTLADISKMPPAIQAQIYGKPVPVLSIAAKTPPKPKEAPSLRQDTKGLNGLERAFHDELRRTMPQIPVHVHAITLKLANGVRYTADFALELSDGRWHLYETKGFMRDDASVKIKVAAAMYRTITFTLVTRKKGVWRYEQVLP